MRLMKEDSMILAQLVETLGTIVICAHEKPDLTTMVERLLLFFATLRSHRDVVVRRALLQQTLLFVSSNIKENSFFFHIMSNTPFFGRQGCGTLDEITGDRTG